MLVYRIVNGVCKSISLTYNDYAAFFLNPILYGLLPVTVLASFGYATFVNIKHITRTQQRNREKIEEQLTKSLILQCASFIFSQVSISIFCSDEFIENKNFHLFFS